jgi:heme/copper-type cytochrome/quinol oxidase subunit 2
MLPFLLATAALGLVLTALTHAELRRRATTEPTPFKVPSGPKIFIWMLIASILVLLGIGVVGWTFDFFRGAL